MQSLRQKISRSVFYIVLPLNVLIIIFGIIVIQQMYQLTTETMRQELRRTSQSMQTDLDTLAEFRERLQKDCQQEIWRMSRGVGDGKDTYTVWKMIRAMRQNSRYAVVGYLKTPDDIPRLTIDTSFISVPESNALQKVLSETELDSYKVMRLQEFETADEKYLIWNMNAGSLSYGFLFSIRYMFETNDPTDMIIYDSLLREDSSLIYGEKENIVLGHHVEEVLADSTYLLRRDMPWQGQALFLPVLIIVVFLVTIYFIPMDWKILRREVIIPMKEILHGISEISSGNLDFRINEEWSSNEFCYLSQSFNEMTEEIKHLKISAYEKEIEHLKIVADNLMLQVNPHLLLNSLNMIYSLSVSNKQDILRQYTIYLMDYFRYTLRTTDELVPLKAELQFVEEFLKIQQIRFPGAVEGSFDVEEGLEEVTIPPLMIENFVENSIKYGRSGKGVLHVRTKIQKDGESIQIEISDDGKGMEKETLTMLNNGEVLEDEFGRHIGIWNCRKRMELFYGAEGRMEIESNQGEGTRVILHFPWRNEDDAFDRRR